jgi:hypothetical protein
MRTASPRLLCAALVLALMIVLAGCGKTGRGQQQPLAGGPTARVAPVARQGAVSVVTRNTTRLGGADPATDAAAVARLVYPGLTAATRPRAVVLVDERRWSAALAASVLAAAPLRAPLLYSEGNTLPAVSREALEAMHPAGEPALGGAQVIRIGTSAGLPNGYLARSMPAGEPSVAAAALAGLLPAIAGGKAPHQVIVLAADAPRALEMPAAGLAAESGAPIVFVTSGRIPPATATALTALHRPSIYVVASATIGVRTLHDLSRFGPVTPIAGAGPPAGAESPVGNAISVARFTDGVFGWGIKEPGHGLVFANPSRPLDAPAAALLSATGDYGPLLLLESATGVPAVLGTYLADIQPAYTTAPQFRPVRGVYNHGWLIGDESAISALTQAEIDPLLEISPRKPSSEEPSVSPVE